MKRSMKKTGAPWARRSFVVKGETIYGSRGRSSIAISAYPAKTIAAALR